MRDFNKDFKDFDKCMKKFAIGWFVFSAVASLSLLGFVIWVVIKFMQHNGVI